MKTVTLLKIKQIDDPIVTTPDIDIPSKGDNYMTSTKHRNNAKYQ